MKRPILFLLLLTVSLQAYGQHAVPLSGSAADSVAAQTKIDKSFVGTMDENALDDDAQTADQGISSTMIMSNDVFLNSVGYQLSPFYFKVRGYSNTYEKKFINGVNFNDQNRGVFNYASIGALNDITRNGDADFYHSPSIFTYGSIGGSENLNMRAGSFLRGTKITVSAANRNYYFRGMATYATGMMDNGWAFMASVGGRYSERGAIPGTFYRNLSYAFAAEKRFRNGEHSLSFTTFGSPVERGQQGSSFQEVYDLVGDNHYNPNWGYQNGEIRNSRVVRAFDPTAILSHIWKIDPKTTLTTGLGVHFAAYGNTALNWYNGPEPRPDYYRYLPSYNTENEDVFNFYTEKWKSNDPRITQIDWDNLYRMNALAGGSAIYMVEMRHSDLLEGTLNSTLNVQISDRHKITAGVEIRKTRSMQYKTVDDLLGAEYLLDIDKFSERDFPGNTQVVQNDLNRPDRIVREDGIFGYNFNLDINSYSAWVLSQYAIRKVDFFYGTKITFSDLRRSGLMKNGRYPENSYGKGELHTFVDHSLKAGVNYKITGRHFLTANVSYTTEAPLPDRAYVSSRISGKTARELKSGKVFSADLSYIFSLPSFTGRVSLFHTGFSEQMERFSYYHDGERTFVNHVLTGVEKRHRGVEFGAKYRLDNHWSFDLAGSVGDYIYANNPEGTISYENASKEDAYETVFMKNYRIGGVPQTAGTLGINYFINYWFFSVNLNYADRTYIEIAPLRRLASNYRMTPTTPGIDPSDPADMETYRKLTDQERFAAATTVDVSIGKIFYLNGKKQLNFNLSLNNILNNKDIRTGGYESGRLDLTAPDKYASKYFYMQGFNFFLNVSFKM